MMITEKQKKTPFFKIYVMNLSLQNIKHIGTFLEHIKMKFQSTNKQISNDKSESKESKAAEDLQIA